MKTLVPISLRILHIAGSPDDELSIRSQLEAGGVKAEYYRIDREADFLPALAPSPDLILFDLSPSPFSFIGALHLLQERKLEIPIILISDREDEDAAMTLANQGTNDYLTKDDFARLGFAVKRALDQKHLRASEARYRDIFENASVMIWDEDLSELKAEVDKLRANGIADFRSYIKQQPEFLRRALKLVNIIDANETTLRLFYAQEKTEVLGSLDRFVSPETFQEELIAFADGKSYFEREFISQTTQGKSIHLLMTVTFYEDSAGRCKALVHLTDITERKKAEQSLRESEARFRTLVEKIPPIIYISGLKQYIGVTYISPQINALGFTQEEWIADPELWFKQISSEDQPKVLEDIELSVNSGKPFRSEYRLIGRDGKTKWILDEAVIVEDTEGRPLFIQGFMLDITARKEIEESLSSRERYLALLNEMTRAILLSQEIDSTLHTLAVNMAKLIQADDCYIARWDEERKTVIPVAATSSIAGSQPSYRDSRSEDLKMALAVLDVRHALAADDAYDSPFVNVDLAQKLGVRSGLGIPLIAGEHKLGAAILAFKTPHHFTPEEIERAEQAGNQVALALWNFQQGVEIQQRLRESTTLAKIERTLSETEHIGTGEILQLIVDSARELMPPAEKSVIHLLEAKENVLFARAVSGYDAQEKENTSLRMRLGEGVAGKVIREGIPINVADIQAYPDFLLNDSLPEFRSLLVAPVQVSGQPIGTISLQSTATNAFSRKDSELLNALAVQAAIAIENTRLFETTQQSLKEINILYQISRGLATSLDANQLIRDTIRLLQQLFGYFHVQIYLIDPETRNLVVRHGSGYIGNELVQRGHYLPAGEGIVGHVAQVGEPFLTNNVEEVVFFKRNPLLLEIQSELAVPIRIDRQVTGVLDIQQIPPHRLSDGDLRLMSAIAEQLAVVLQKANLYSTLQTALQQEQMIRLQLIQSERLALVGRLLASVSHELNNPLQAIQNALFLLREEKNISTQAQQDLDVILSEAERMAALIERLRSAYRPVRMKDFQPVELNNLIEDVHALISTHMRQKQIVFQFHPEVNLPPVSGLPDQLRQVVLNLFLNAIEVMEPGGRLTVDTQSLPPQREVLLTVTDTGPGIDAEILPRIFDAFITSKHTGTGLGLAISHDIIQQHHGRIQARNNPDEGASFKIWLPMDKRAA